MLRLELLNNTLASVAVTLGIVRSGGLGFVPSPSRDEVLIPFCVTEKMYAAIAGQDMIAFQVTLEGSFRVKLF